MVLHRKASVTRLQVSHRFWPSGEERLRVSEPQGEMCLQVPTMQLAPHTTQTDRQTYPERGAGSLKPRSWGAQGSAQSLGMLKGKGGEPGWVINREDQLLKYRLPPDGSSWQQRRTFYRAEVHEGKTQRAKCRPRVAAQACSSQIWCCQSYWLR